MKSEEGNIKFALDMKSIILRGIADAGSKDGIKEDVSVLFYVPIRKLGEAESEHGFLLDLMSEEVGLAGQCASSGRTGAFFSDSRYLDGLKINSQKIDKALSDNFKLANARMGKLGENLLTIEYGRYSNRVKWPKVLELPLNSYIHQVVISPDRTEHRGCTGNTVFGVVYTISKTEHPDRDVAAHMTQMARSIGNCIFKAFVHTFFRTPSKIILGLPADDCYRMIMMFLLSHHWFFPQKPIARNLILGAS